MSRGDGSSDPSSGRSLPVLAETLLLVLAALICAAVIKALFVQAFFIPSGSMEPGLQVDDRILVEKPSYWFGSPARGDTVVFADPGGWLSAREAAAPAGAARALELVGLYPSGGHLVKRVVGVGGDEVRCCDAQGRLAVNDVPVREAYLPSGLARASAEDFDVRVPDGYLWVLGDNRDHSSDSRAHLGDPGGGMVPVDDVVGKVVAVVWPWSQVRVVHRPEAWDRLSSGEGRR